MNRLPLTALALAAVTAVAFGGRAALAQSADLPADQDPLSPERWQEEKYGISLRPPLDSKLTHETIDDALLTIQGPARSSTQVYLREMKSDAEVGQFLQTDPTKPNAPPTRVTYDNRAPVSLDMDSLVDIGLKQVAVARPQSVLLDQQRLQVADRPAAILYFNLPPDEKQRRWVLGHAYLLVNPRTFAMLRLSAAQEDFAAVRPVFEAVVRSLQVQDPAQRDQLRQEQIREGQQWRASITAQQYRQGLIEEQWLRMLDGSKDIGYVQITQKHGLNPKTKEPGITVHVRARVVRGNEALDSDSDFFLPDSAQSEVWSSKATRRPLKPAAGPAPAAGFVPPKESSAVETGTRSGDQIILVRQDAVSAKRFEWKTPPQGYLAQAELYLMPQFLPRRTTPIMGFYAYYPNQGTISYRTVKVEAGQDGAYKVTVQPAPNAPEEVSLYDRNGRLIERTLPGGVRLIPTDRAKLVGLWKDAAQ